jgi:hypothetical protein
MATWDPPDKELRQAIDVFEQKIMRQPRTGEDRVAGTEHSYATLYESYHTLKAEWHRRREIELRAEAQQLADGIDTIALDRPPDNAPRTSVFSGLRVDGLGSQ